MSNRRQPRLPTPAELNRDRAFRETHETIWRAYLEPVTAKERTP